MEDGGPEMMAASGNLLRTDWRLNPPGLRLHHLQRCQVSCACQPVRASPAPAQPSAGAIAIAIPIARCNLRHCPHTACSDLNLPRRRTAHPRDGQIVWGLDSLSFWSGKPPFRPHVCNYLGTGPAGPGAAFHSRLWWPVGELLSGQQALSRAQMLISEESTSASIVPHVSGHTRWSDHVAEQRVQTTLLTSGWSEKQEELRDKGLFGIATGQEHPNVPAGGVKGGYSGPDNTEVDVIEVAPSSEQGYPVIP